MVTKRLRPLVLSLVFVSLSVYPGQARRHLVTHAASALPPTALVLTLADLPPGFTLSNDTYWNNAQAATLAGIRVSVLKAVGRKMGYEVVYGRSAPTGIILVDNEVIEYRTAAGAHLDFLRAARAGRSAMREMSPGSFANEIRGYTSGPRAAGTTIDSIVFRKGRRVSFVTVTGITGTFQPEDDARLAKIVNARIGRSW